MQISKNLSQRTATHPLVQVVFDPSRVDGNPISIVPETIRVIRGQGTEVEFSLTTLGSGGPGATFSPMGPITLADNPADGALLKASSTRLLLRPKNTPTVAAQGPVRRPYHVRVEFEGRQYVSQGYPTYEEQSPVVSG